MRPSSLTRWGRRRWTTTRSSNPSAPHPPPMRASPSCRRNIAPCRDRCCDEVTSSVLDSVNDRATRNETEPVSVDDRRARNDPGGPVPGPIRVNAVKAVDAIRLARPPEIVAVDRRPRRLDTNDRAHVVAGATDMPDDDLGIMVSRDRRRRAGTRMIRSELVGEGSVVLLEPAAIGRQRRESGPRAALRERVLHADEAGGCYGTGRDRCGWEERRDQDAAEEFGQETEAATGPANVLPGSACDRDGPRPGSHGGDRTAFELRKAAESA